MKQSHAVLYVSLAVFLAFASIAEAKQRRTNTPGAFDFYVLSLSWSPSFCVEHDNHPEQCVGQPYGFVVHGLWPQYTRGFPSYCQHRASAVDRSIIISMQDIMPSPTLIANQWNKHGTCSGLSAADYFKTLRKALSDIKIPEEYEALETTKIVSPNAIEAAFIVSNPGLDSAAITVTCDHNRLSEVRICLSKNLKFSSCKEVNRRSCRQQQLQMPPVRTK